MSSAPAPAPRGDRSPSGGGTAGRPAEHAEPADAAGRADTGVRAGAAEPTGTAGRVETWSSQGELLAEIVRTLAVARRRAARPDDGGSGAPGRPAAA